MHAYYVGAKRSLKLKQFIVLNSNKKYSVREREKAGSIEFRFLFCKSGCDSGKWKVIWIYSSLIAWIEPFNYLSISYFFLWRNDWRYIIKCVRKWNRFSWWNKYDMANRAVVVVRLCACGCYVFVVYKLYIYLSSMCVSVSVCFFLVIRHVTTCTRPSDNRIHISS